jgi:RND family efflux transporter MFP subunit
MPFARFAAVVLIAGMLVGCRKLAQPPADEKIPPAPVKWEGIQQHPLAEWTDLVGTTEPLPDHDARVTAPVDGRVLAVLSAAAGKPVAEGQLVEAGDILVKLDDTVLRATRDKAVAAKTVLVADKVAADFAVKQADIEVRRLVELKRQQEARGPGGLQLVAPIEMEKAMLGLDAAQARARADEVRLAAADNEIAALDRQLKHYTLTSPRRGRLGRIQVVVGQTLAAGAFVAEVIDLEDEIDVICFVPSSDARKLKLGQPVRIGGVDRDPADADVDPEGKVVFIADQAEVESGLFAAEMRFPNRDMKLRANSVIRVRVLTKPDKVCWAIPDAALMEDSDPPSVVVVEDIEEKPLPNGKEEKTGKARRLRAIIGVRDRVKKQVEVLRLEDPEKKWHGDLKTAVIVVEKGQGLQTGDAIKLEMDEDEGPPPMPEEKKP